ncbi:hypothetical protein F5Y17DRAFT_453559 [Xylariaceae sp. FL0594]|nr:hypothetical protein F5Y17DRAFT_453559 [Xylariaceae sp. FL0594]
MVIPVTGTDTLVQRLYDIPVLDAYDEDLGRGDDELDNLDYLGPEMGGQNSDYLGSLPSQAYPDKTDPAQWLVEMPPSPGMALQTQPSSLELFHAQESPASANQILNDFGMGDQSENTGTVTDMFCLGEDFGTLCPAISSPKAYSGEPVCRDLPAAVQEETTQIFLEGQLILWKPARETILKHFPTTSQHGTLPPISSPPQVDSKEAGSLFHLRHIPLASESNTVEPKNEPGKGTNSASNSNQPAIQGEWGFQSRVKDTSNEMADSDKYQPAIPEDDTVKSPKRKRSGPPVFTPKKVRIEAPEKQRGNFANTRFEKALYQESPDSPQQEFKLERRRYWEWPTKSGMLLQHLEDNPAGLSILVRPEAGNIVRMEWSKREGEFVYHDIVGRRYYQVSMAKMESLLRNPKNHAEFWYRQY